tara:strand:- start:9 stop:296 length:288 start_codon:yes stop_codon:yes gene_type:complete
MTKRRRKRHTPEQIIRKLRDAETMLNAGKTLGEVCQQLEISEQSHHRWQAQYGGMKAEEARRLKELEQENTRLKKLLAEAELDKAMLKEIAEGNW